MPDFSSPLCKVVPLLPAASLPAANLDNDVGVCVRTRKIPRRSFLGCDAAIEGNWDGGGRYQRHLHFRIHKARSGLFCMYEKCIVAAIKHISTASPTYLGNGGPGVTADSLFEYRTMPILVVVAFFAGVCFGIGNLFGYVPKTAKVLSVQILLTFRLILPHEGRIKTINLYSNLLMRNQ